MDIANANATEMKDKTLILNSIRLPKAQTKACGLRSFMPLGVVHAHANDVFVVTCGNCGKVLLDPWGLQCEELTDLTAEVQDENYTAVMLGLDL